MNTVRILIIGNDDINLQIIKNRLLEFGEDWLIFQMSCEDAIHELNNSQYNIIIIDCVDTSNVVIDRIAAFKQSKKNYDTPILVCFQEAESAHIKQVIEAGALDFIQKPFKAIELFARVRTALTLSSTINKLGKQAHIISAGQQKMEEVLKGLLPNEIIDELTVFGESKPKKYREASVLFIDLVDFTRKSAKLSPRIIIDELSELFSSFDDIMRKNNCVRIKTMGDGYLAVSGIPKPNMDHAINLINAAIDLRNYLIQRNRVNPVKWEAKIGINSGEVIGSVLGSNNFLFDVFGDAVNEAARMEKNCEPNQINISKETYLLARHKFRFIERLPNKVKGLGVKRMFYLKSHLDHTGFNHLDIERIKESSIGTLINLI
ncbi:response regulator [Labilibacter sediminis]|nr:response regulator [Labilibacter sediminis]